MTNLQTVLDRELIEQVRYRFGAALDTRDWEGFAELFTDDATGDFTSFGVAEPRVDKATIIAMFRSAFALPADRLATQQLIGNVVVEVTGDTATSRSYLHGHHRLPGHPGGDEVDLRARYDDHLVRTPTGWRIDHTVLEVISITGNAAILAPV